MTSTEITLHRYYLWANRMRTHLHLFGDAPEDEMERKLWLNAVFSYKAMWLSLLYVVAEGWQELKLDDPRVNGLLLSSHLGVLRRFRNGAFHFQKDYFDERFTDFLTSEPAAQQWAKELHESIGEWFLRRAQESFGPFRDGA